MAQNTHTFSESWYRIANQKIHLRPGVRIRRQFYRGERWYVLENPHSNQFFRLRPEAYEFVARLRPDQTVEQVWEASLELSPDSAPGQEEVIRLLAQLYLVGLLQYENPADTAELFRRFKQRRQREMRAKFMNLMFIRFPLLDPDRFLKRMLPIVGPLISWVGFLVWAVVLGGAIKLVIDHFPALKDESQSILSPSNLGWLYVGLIILKTLHEFGHAFFCKKFGGEVHVMGVMLMIFTPIPYVDASSSWSFSSRWQRALVGMAGMIVEMFVAALAVFVWANTGAGVLHSLAYNMMFVASVSTVLFNLNPLLRFDGYYILSDLLDYPNLHQHSSAHLMHSVKRHAYGVASSRSPGANTKEKSILCTFGILSHLYRLVVFTGILLFVADRFLILGIIMAVICLTSWILAPIGKLIYYLLANPELERTRGRAFAVTMGFVLGLLAILQFVPLPHHFRATGVVEAASWSEVVTKSEGVLTEFFARPGETVVAGTPLFRLSNPELQFQIDRAESRVAETQMRLLQAMSEEEADLQPLQVRLESTEKALNDLTEQQKDLIVNASVDGIWTAPEVEHIVGRWLVRGSSLGRVINPASFDFVSPVLQEDVNRLFGDQIRHSDVRLFGVAELRVPVASTVIIPAEKRSLPSAALGWAGGGDIPVATDDSQGITATEPFFEVRSSLAGAEMGHLIHGRSGKIRFRLAPEPLLPRWIRSLRQLLQRRYRI
ncbi:hypothetical protein N9B57_02150 [Verrucomicrobia bacterium]|jgi:putative peptide zinc metalloprotease protein|nr:hypothetical protein [Verrucomicrobiota bacterium]MDA7866716.1 hypothetical protein [Verrucomicrobiota bacterium]MDB4798639.1 hypothetical protein [Verrucomicrobiota bacterium]